MSPMKHDFQYKAHDLVGLFTGVTTCKELYKRINKQASLAPERYDENKYKGDAFEFFIELVYKLMPYNKDLFGLSSYEPEQEDDMGVDATALNLDDKPTVVQVKYRTASQELTAKDHIANLAKEAYINHKLPLPTDGEAQTMLIVTNIRLNKHTETEFLRNYVKCVTGLHLSTVLDDNISFWRRATELVTELEDANT